MIGITIKLLAGILIKVNNGKPPILIGKELTSNKTSPRKSIGNEIIYILNGIQNVKISL